MPPPNGNSAQRQLEIRELDRTDEDSLRSHLLRLDAKDRFMRFCNMVDDARINLFVERLNWFHSRFIGGFIDGVLRGVVQLSPTNDGYKEAEFAISVDSSFRGAGMAFALMNHAITFAKADGVSTLVMTSLSDNRAIKNLAGNLGFKLSPLQEQIVGELDLQHWLDSSLTVLPNGSDKNTPLSKSLDDQT